MKHARPSRGLLNTVRSDPHGDTRLVQVNDQEVGLLKRLGGAGVRNPRTGLLQFYPAGAMGGGSNPGGDRGGYAGRDTNAGGGGAGGHDPGQNPDAANKTTRNAQVAERDWRGALGDPNSQGPTGVTADPYGKAVNEYSNGLRGWLERNLGIMGIGTQRPTLGVPSTYSGGTTHVGVNWGGLAGGALGAAMGGPFSMAMGPIGTQVANAAGVPETTLSGPMGVLNGGPWAGHYGDPNAASTSGPSSTPAGYHEQNGADQLAQGALAASTGHTGTVGAIPASITSLGLLGNWQPAGVGQTAPGYNYQTPGYGYLSWG